MQRISIINASSRNAIETYVKDSIDSWVTKFFLDTPFITVSFSDIIFNDNCCHSNSNSIFEINGGHILIIDYQEVFQKLARKSLAVDSVFNVSADPVFWKEIIEIMRKDLFQRFTSKNHFTEKKESNNSNTFRSSVEINIQFDDISLKISMNYDLLKHLELIKPSPFFKDNREQLISLNHSVKNQKVQLKAKLRGSSIQLNDFLELKTGDVLKLQHAVDEGLILMTQDKTLAVNAFLVKSKSNKAVLLTK